MLNSKDQFIEDYVAELIIEIKRFKTINPKEINATDIEKAITTIDKRYDVGVSDFLYESLFDKDRLHVNSLADLAARNMNYNGTEMSMILNALVDFNNILYKYITEADDE